MNRLVRKLFKKLAAHREVGLIFFIVIMGIIMSFLSPYFLTQRNIFSVLMGASITTIVAVPMCNLMVSGGFDLSVGSVLGFTGVTVGVLINLGVPAVLAIFAGLILGISIGLFNGLSVTKLGINPFVVTLAGLSLFRGLTYIITNGMTQTRLGDLVAGIGQGKLFGLQYPAIYAIFLVIIGDILLRNTVWFRRSYLIGSSQEAARLKGISVEKTKIFNYVLVSFFAAFAGIVQTGRLGAATVNAGTGLELRVIAAVIIGGASLSGGKGTVLGAFLGSLLMVLIVNMLTLLGVSAYWQTFVEGLTLFLAVVVDRMSTRYIQER